MSNVTRTLSFSLLLAFPLLLLGAPAEAKDPKGKKPRPAPAAKKVPHAVIVLSGEFEVLPTKALKDKKKQLAKEYKEAVKAHKAAKKEAKKNKQKFREKKPKRPAFKVLKAFPSQEAAQAYVEKLKAEAEKRKNRGKKKK